MLSKFFTRKSRQNEQGQSEIDLSARPKAGEIRQQGLTETLFVSPLPLPTGKHALGRGCFADVNDVYLEIGGTNKGMIATAKLAVMYVWLLVFVAVFMPAVLTLSITAFPPEHVQRTSAENWEIFKMFLNVALILTAFMTAIGVWVHIFGTLSDVRALAKQYPIRFNRQRREVCYIDPKRNNEVVIVPWEQVVAWVSTTQMLSQYGATRMHNFGLALERGKGDDILFLQWAHPSETHSLGMWEGIRRYMEEGTLNNEKESSWLRTLGIELTDLEKLPYEGLHSFEVEKRIAYMNGNLHRDDDYSRRIGLTISKWPLRWWYVRRVLTFWKLPYQIAEWAHRTGRPVLPEGMQQWSQPLPVNQWTKPSEALKKAVQQVRKAMAKGTEFAEACMELKH